MAPAPSPQTREDQRPIHAQIEEGEKRVETLSLAYGKSRAWTGHTASRLGAKDKAGSMQRCDCKDAFLSKGKSMTAPVPRKANPPGLPPACVPQTGLR